MIKITITKTTKNEKYAEECKDFANNRVYGFPEKEYPQKENIDKVLEVELTEEEFQIFKRQILEII